MNHVLGDILPFHRVLCWKVEKLSGKRFDPKRRTGAGVWLAQHAHITPTTAGRYLRGTAIPIPSIARRISVALHWPMNEMMLTILEVESFNKEIRVLKKYGCTELLEHWTTKGLSNENMDVDSAARCSTVHARRGTD